MRQSRMEFFCARWSLITFLCLFCCFRLWTILVRTPWMSAWSTWDQILFTPRFSMWPMWKYCWCKAHTKTKSLHVFFPARESHARPHLSTEYRVESPSSKSSSYIPFCVFLLSPHNPLVRCNLVNIDANDLIKGTPHLVLGLLWQIIRFSFSSKLSFPDLKQGWLFSLNKVRIALH